MPDRSSKPKIDAVQNAGRIVPESVDGLETVQPAKWSVASQVMAEMGRKGGRIGGKRRLETLSDRRRTEIARKAAQARWSKKKSAA